MTNVASTARARRLRALAFVASASVAFAPSITAQARTDTTRARTDTSRAQRLERVTISAVRGSGEAPISQKTIDRADLEKRYFGQDVPLLLQGAAPSLTSYAETGNYWGYSYIRLRGIDQSRINLTLDGIPLNDPEDQVLYFADFPDLANSLGSVQVQRGVGTSSNGTAAYAGSINMESIPLAATPQSGSVQVQAGSFDSKRVSADFTSGLLPSRFAFYGRMSYLTTGGYRYHSGLNGRSVFFSGGYFGDRDILKLTVTTGGMRDTMAYVAVAKSDLDTNRRINPLTPQERDGFSERIAALSYTRLLTPGASWSTTAYRISSAGDYDVLIDSLDNFNEVVRWYGATTDFTLHHDAWQLDLGANGNLYSRDHAEYQRPEITIPLYKNTGHKRDASAFAKLGYTVGAATFFGDLQARRAWFLYLPSNNADISPRAVDWSFLNPKGGVTYALTPKTSLYASYGVNTREPARSDMFAGADNMDTSNVAFIGDLSRVKPETVHDVEMGTTYHGDHLSLQANLYSMDFHNEIQPIGQLTVIGTPLSKNVASSYRRGIEADASYQPFARLRLSANASASMNRIREYVDSSGDVPVTYHNVEPLLTPRFLTYQRAEFAATRAVTLAVESRYQARSFLQNDSDPRYVLPSSEVVDGSVAWQVSHYQIVFRANNLNDSKRYGSGYAFDGVSYYYVLPPRNFFVTVRAAF